MSDRARAKKAASRMPTDGEGALRQVDGQPVATNRGAHKNEFEKARTEDANEECLSSLVGGVRSCQITP